MFFFMYLLAVKFNFFFVFYTIIQIEIYLPISKESLEHAVIAQSLPLTRVNNLKNLTQTEKIGTKATDFETFCWGPCHTLIYFFFQRPL